MGAALGWAVRDIVALQDGELLNDSGNMLNVDVGACERSHAVRQIVGIWLRTISDSPTSWY